MDVSSLIEQMKTQRDALTTAIDALEGIGATTPPVRRGKVGRPRKVRPARPTLATSNSLASRVVDAVRRGYTNPRAIAADLHEDKSRVAFQLRSLTKAGKLVKSGQTTATVYRVAS